MEQGTEPCVVIGGKEFAVPKFADTVIDGWRVIDGVVQTPGRYDVHEWGSAAVADYERRKAAHGRFTALPGPVRAFLYRYAEPWDPWDGDDYTSEDYVPPPRFYNIKHRAAQAAIRAFHLELSALTDQQVRVSNNYATGFVLRGITGALMVNNTATGPLTLGARVSIFGAPPLI